MKTTQLIIVAGALLSLFACKQDTLELYHGKDAIYFQGAVVSDIYTPKEIGNFSFGYLEPEITLATHRIIVNAMGKSVSHDRPYTLDILPESDLVKGRDFDFEDPSFVIKAGQLKDTVQLVLHRTAELKEKDRFLYVKLNSNEHFSTEMNSQLVGSGETEETRYFTQYSFYANDIQGTPYFWDPLRSNTANTVIGYLGTFSGKKFKLLVDYFDLNFDEVTAIGYGPAAVTILAWSSGLKAYLDEMQAVGTPILDEDDQPMKLGVYAN